MLATWSDTLTEFLQSSNENVRVIDSFNQRVLPLVQPVGRKLKWLEIGPGDGSKTVEIARSIATSGKASRIELTLCEPSKWWIDTLHKEGRVADLQRYGFLVIEQKTFEELVTDTSQLDFDLITAIQVCYSRSIESSLVELVRSKAHKNRLLWIDVEADNSEFGRIRTGLASLGFYPTKSCYKEVLKYLRESNIPYETFTVDNKWCKIDSHSANSDDCYWLFPFLLGLTNEEFLKMPLPDRDMVLETIRDYLGNLKSNSLLIPDYSILTYA